MINKPYLGLLLGPWEPDTITRDKKFIETVDIFPADIQNFN